MTTKNPQTCLSAELLRQLSHDELSPAELKDVEDHVSDCERCRQLLEVPQSDRQWQDEIVPILRTPLESTHVVGDHDERGSEGESLESILRLLGPTDDPRMLGRIGSYEVVGVIGRGGMGVVFKAYEGALNRFVAIKMLLPHLAVSGAARKRFAREGKAAAAVIDDNVMPIYSVAEWQGVPYLVTQYSRGTTLQKRIQDQGPQELKEILRIGMQTARGLAAAHAQGLVHRDVKPSNILLDGTVERALLTDFGLARAVDDASITRTGVIAGTPQYMSPEQARGGSVDARSDLFSLGCVLYFLCTGHPPFRADNSYAILRLITDEEPRSMREINPDVPEWLSSVVQKLMAKSDYRRYGSATEVAELLETCLAHVQQPTTVPLPESLRAKSGCSANFSRYQRKVPAMLVLTIIITTVSFLMMPDERPSIPLPASEAKPNIASVDATKGSSARRETSQADSHITTVFPGGSRFKKDLRTLVSLTTDEEQNQWPHIERYIDIFLTGMDSDRPIEIRPLPSLGDGTVLFWVPLSIEKTPFRQFRETLESIGYIVTASTTENDETLFAIVSGDARGWIRVDSRSPGAWIGLTSRLESLDLLKQVVRAAGPSAAAVEGSVVTTIVNSDHSPEAQEYRRRAFQNYRQQSLEAVATEDHPWILPEGIHKWFLTMWLDEYQLLLAEGTVMSARIKLDRADTANPGASAILSATAIGGTALATTISDLATHEDAFASVTESDSSMFSMRMNLPIADLRRRTLQSFTDLVTEELLHQFTNNTFQSVATRTSSRQLTEGVARLLKTAIASGQFNGFAEGRVQNGKPHWIGALVVPNAGSFTGSLTQISQMGPGNSVELNVQKVNDVSIHRVTLAGESLSFVRTWIQSDGQLLVGIGSNKIWFATGENAMESLVSQIETLTRPKVSSSAFHLNARLSAVVSTLINIPAENSESTSSLTGRFHELLRNATRSLNADDDLLTIDVASSGDTIDANVSCDTGILRMLGHQLAKFSKENLE
ncbi:MAG: serine/threonine protein kinase [Planctomycetaceae bacterium]|nr:serine/threonine protein kinase [Planctomycetaceae bacterium]